MDGLNKIRYKKKMDNFKLKLGKKAKDKITMFEGIIIARAEHLFGCNTYGLAPQAFDKGTNKRGDTEWFDEGRLEIIGEGIAPEDVQTTKPGCDHRDHP